MFRLNNKVALVTGAARGIGAATAGLLAQQRAGVAAADCRVEEIRESANNAGGSVKAFRVDVSKTAEARVLVDAVVAEFSRIDILVNNAGICPRLPFVESTEADWDRLVAVNAR